MGYDRGHYGRIQKQLENTGEILRSSSLYVLFPKCGNEAVDDVLQMPVLCGGEVRDF